MKFLSCRKSTGSDVSHVCFIFWGIRFSDALFWCARYVIEVGGASPLSVIRGNDSPEGTL